MRSTYTVYYIASNGQPDNGEREFTNKRKALAQAKSNDGALLHGSGGRSVCREHCDGKVRDLRVWHEHCEGGYFSATPLHPTDWDTDWEVEI
jgi:hypothetical protein